MSFIGNVFHDIGSAVKGVVEAPAHLMGDAASLGKNILTLSPEGAMQSVEHMADHTLQAAGDLASLTPAGRAATIAMDGGVAAVHAMSSDPAA
jgi:phage-related protein